MGLLFNKPQGGNTTNTQVSATPQTPGQIRTGGLLFGKTNSGGQASPQAPAVTNESSPLGIVDRLKFSFGDREGKKKVLEAMGYKVYDTADDNFLLSKDGQTRPFDEKGWSLKDLADFAGPALSFIGFGVGEAIGGPAGAGAGSAAGNVLEQGIGLGLGVRSAYNPLETAGEAAAGFAGSKVAGMVAPKLVEVAGKQILQPGLIGKIAPGFAAKTAMGTAKETIPGLITREVATGAGFGGASSFAGTLAQTGDVGQAIKAVPGGALQGAIFQPVVGLGLRGLGVKPGVSKTAEVKTPEVKPGEIPPIKTSMVEDAATLQRKAETIVNVQDKIAADPKYIPTPEESAIINQHTVATTKIASADISSKAHELAIIQVANKPDRGVTSAQAHTNIEEAFKNPTDANVGLRKSVERQAKGLEKKIAIAGGITNFENTQLGQDLKYQQDLMTYIKTGKEPTSPDMTQPIVSSQTPPTTTTPQLPETQPNIGPVATLASAPIEAGKAIQTAPATSTTTPRVEPVVTEKGTFLPTPEIGIFSKEVAPGEFNLTQKTDKGIFTLLDKPKGETKKFPTYRASVDGIDSAPGLEKNPEFWRGETLSPKSSDILSKTPPSEHLVQSGEIFTNQMSPEELAQMGKEGGVPSDMLATGEAVGSTMKVSGGNDVTPKTFLSEKKVPAIPGSKRPAVTESFMASGVKTDNMTQKLRNEEYLNYKRAEAVSGTLPKVSSTLPHETSNPSQKETAYGFNYSKKAGEYNLRRPDAYATETIKALDQANKMLKDNPKNPIALLRKVSAESALGIDLANAPQKIEEALSIGQKTLTGKFLEDFNNGANALKETLIRTNKDLATRYGPDAAIPGIEKLSISPVPDAITRIQKELYNTANVDLGIEIAPGKRLSFADFIMAKLAEDKSAQGDSIYRVVRDIWKDTKFNKLIKDNYKWATVWNNATPKDIESFVWATLAEKGIPNPDVSLSRVDFNAWQQKALGELKGKGLTSKNIADGLGVMKYQKLTPEEAIKLKKVQATFGSDILWAKYKQPEFVKFGDVPGGKVKTQESTFIEGQKVDRAFLRQVLGPEQRFTKKMTPSQIEEAIATKRFKEKWAHIYKKTETTKAPSGVLPQTADHSLTPSEFMAQAGGNIPETDFLHQYALEGGANGGPFNSAQHFLNKINKVVNDGEAGTGSLADRIRSSLSDEQIKQAWSDANGKGTTLLSNKSQEPVGRFADGPGINPPKEVVAKTADLAGNNKLLSPKQRGDVSLTASDVSPEAMKVAAAAQRGETPIDAVRQARIDEVMKTLSHPAASEPIGPPLKGTIKEKTQSLITRILGIPRAIMSSFDVSGGRQNIFLLAGRPKIFGEGFAKQFKSLRSEADFQDVMKKDVTSSKYYDLGQSADRKLSIMNLGENMNLREEKIQSNLAEKFPLGIGKGVRASNRAFTTMMNVTRTKYYEFLVDKAKGMSRDPMVDKNLNQQIIDLVNLSTGRGALSSSAERFAPLLNSIFFSPRLMMSRLTLLNPMYYIKADPFVRQEALRSLLSMGAGATAILLMMNASGLATVESDPRSTDFAKIKIGKTRVDILGGFQQYLRAAAQLTSGQVKDSKGRVITLGEGYKSQTRKDVLFNFFENKESPVFSFANTMLQVSNSGKDPYGNTVNIPAEIASRFTPMVFQDLLDIYNSDPSLLPAGLAGFFGAGVQTY